MSSSSMPSYFSLSPSSPPPNSLTTLFASSSSSPSHHDLHDYHGSLIGNFPIHQTQQPPPAPPHEMQPPDQADGGGSKKGSRKRRRASRKAPTTVLNTDTSNFRAMVQEFTGGFSGASPPAPFSFPLLHPSLFAAAASSSSSSSSTSSTNFMHNPFAVTTTSSTTTITTHFQQNLGEGFAGMRSDDATMGAGALPALGFQSHGYYSSRDHAGGDSLKGDQNHDPNDQIHQF